MIANMQRFLRCNARFLQGGNKHIWCGLALRKMIGRQMKLKKLCQADGF
jgi:hypothetical protein